MRQNPHVRIALKAREAQAPEMATAARPSQQPRTDRVLTAVAKRRQGNCRPERK